jgi:hypothetical protein
LLPRRHAELDPRDALVRAVDRLSRRLQFVTVLDVERIAARRSSRLSTDGLAALVEAAVVESLLLKDLRTFFDRKTGAFSERWVYRVNPRHPLAARILGDLA